MRALAVGVVLLAASAAEAGFTICAPAPNSSSPCLVRWDCPCPVADSQGACDYHPGNVQVCGLDYGGGQFLCDGNDEPAMLAYDCKPLGQLCEKPEDRCTLAKWALDFEGWGVDPDTAMPTPESPEATCMAEPTPNPRCETEQRCNPAVTCCPEVGDPYSVKDNLTVHDVTDVEVPTTFGALRLARHFTGSRYAYAWREVLGPATPFGESPQWMHWTHTWHSLVKREGWSSPGGTPSGYVVLDTAGMVQRFEGCWPLPCYASSMTGTTRDVLYAEDGRVTLLREGEGRFVFEDALGARLYLSRWEDQQRPGPGEAARTRAQLVYATPAGCSQYGADAGTPWLDRVESADGVALHFEWSACRLAGVSVSRQGSAAVTAVRYAVAAGEYESTLTATWGADGGARTESYGWQADAGWLITRDGVQVARHSYTSALADFGQGDVELYRKSAQVDAGCSVPGCSAARVYQWTEYAPQRSSTSRLQQRLHAYKLDTPAVLTQPVLTKKDEACDSYECSGTVVRNLSYEALASGPRLKAYNNARGGYSVATYTTPSLSLPAGWPEVKEVSSRVEGATDSAGTSPLLATAYTYSYGDEGQTPRGWPQHVEEEAEASMLMPGQQAKTVTRRDAATNRVTARFRSGWTRAFDETTATWATQARVVGTFFFTRRECTDDVADALGRTLEVHGPCLVADTAATDCAAGEAFPVTQYAYAAADAGTGDAQQLVSETQWPSVTTPTNCTGAALTTTYADYDAWGHARTVTDANGAVTTLEYDGPRLTSRTVAGATTTYEWDGDVLTAVRHPEGNYDVFCYRQAALGSACSRSLAKTRQLQWHAKAPAADGTGYTEARAYFYLADGRLTREETWDGVRGQKRLERSFEENARGQKVRATRGAVGSSLAFGELWRFDADGNVTGVHAAKRGNDCGFQASATQGGSNACANLRLDRLGRLDSLDVAGATSGQTGRTCFTWDGQGNVASVKLGCPTDSASYPGPSCAACPQPATTYQADDFGNVVAMVMPHLGGPAGGGEVKQAFDARGQLRYRQTPTMAAAQGFHRFTTDGLGRLLVASNHRLGASPAVETLFSQEWDEGSSPGAACPQPVNTKGRLRRRTDTFGDTWYQYSAAGLLAGEVRLRHGASCSGALPRDVPHTAYTYTANGQLASVQYPWGRTVTYGYGSSGGVTTGRVASISVTRWDGAQWVPWQAISAVVYEPFGDVRAWQMNGDAATFSAESFAYPASLASLGSCPIARPTTNDVSGRVQLLSVSAGALTLGAGTGGLFQKYLEYDALKVTRQATCWPSTASPVISTPAYHPGEQLLLTGGAYDVRGNRTLMRPYVGSVSNDEWRYADGGVTDRLVQWVRHSGTPAVTYGYDDDGRTTTVTLPNDSSGQPSSVETWVPASATAQGSGGLDSVYQSVSVGGAVYGYYYDGQNRRRLKEYPTGVADEFFYSASNQLLVERGNATLSAPAYRTTDEYVWLDNRPMLVVRGRLDVATDARAADDATTCGRNGATEACGAYFIVTDELPKPVALLDGAGKHARKLAWDAFGAVNRTEVRGAKTAHPYGINQMTNLYTGQPTTAPGMVVSYRYQLDTLDTEGPVGAPADRLEVTQGGQVKATLGGYHRGKVFTPWVQETGQWYFATFQSNGKNCPPEGCLADGGLPDGGNWPYAGVDLVAIETMERQVGARAFDINLRFPGQYFDAETGKHENHNRFYDSAGGRYLSPEPLLQSPAYVRRMAQRGLSVPTYAYALNNPLRYVDPTGLAAECPGGTWIGAPLAVADGSLGVSGIIGFAGIYSCSSAPKTVAVVSVCGFASVPTNFKKMEKHAACGVGAGFAINTPDLAAFQGWSAGGFISAGTGANVTGFVEGHEVSKPDTFGLLVGPGAGFSIGPLACRTWAWEI